MDTNKQAGMPSEWPQRVWGDDEIRDMLIEWANICYYGGRKGEYMDTPNDSEDFLQEQLKNKTACPSPKSEAEVERQIEDIVKLIYHNHLTVKTGTEQLSRLLSAPSKGKYSEEDMIAFAKWTNKTGNYANKNTLQEFLEAPESSNATKK